MSLADANAVSRQTSPQSRVKRSDPRSLRRPDLDGIVNRIFGFDADRPDSLEQTDPRDFDVAFHALQRGAANLGDLQARCDRMQSDLAANAERHRAEIDEARQDLAHWQAIAAELRDKLAHVTDQLVEAERLSVLQAERAAAECRRAEMAERRTQTFERLTLGFHDSILTVFRDRAASASLQAKGADAFR